MSLGRQLLCLVICCQSVCVGPLEQIDINSSDPEAVIGPWRAAAAVAPRNGIAGILKNVRKNRLVFGDVQEWIMGNEQWTKWI